MTGFKSLGCPVILPPARALGSLIGCIETNATDCHKNMAGATIYRDPFTWPAFPIRSKTRRTHRAVQQASHAQHVRNRTRAIIAAILKARVTATIFVGFTINFIGRSDGLMDSFGCGTRRTTLSPRDFDFRYSGVVRRYGRACGQKTQTDQKAKSQENFHKIRRPLHLSYPCTTHINGRVSKWAASTASETPPNQLRLTNCDKVLTQ
jgi:hypothetical protein